MIGLGSKEQKQGIPMGSYDPTASSGGSGGVSSYSDLTNKPSVNDVTLVGNKSASDLGLQEKFTPASPLSFNTSVISDYIDVSVDKEASTWAATRLRIFRMTSSYFYVGGSVNANNTSAIIPTQGAYFPLSDNTVFYQGGTECFIAGIKNSDGSFTPKFFGGYGVSGYWSFCRITSVANSSTSGRVNMYTKRIVHQDVSTSDNIYRAVRFVKTENTMYGTHSSNDTIYKLTLTEESDISAFAACDTVYMPFGSNTNSGTYVYDSNTSNRTGAVDASTIAGDMPTTSEITTLPLVYPNDASSTLYLKIDKASTTQLGVVKPDGTTITATADGTISAIQADPYTLPVATTTTLGGVKPDGTTILVTADGIISAAEGGGSGTTNYLELTNKPSINSVELTGDKSLDELDIQKKLTFQAPITQTTEVTSNMTGAMVNDGYVNVTSYAQGSWYAANAGATQYLQFHEDGSTFSSDNAGFIPNFRIVMPYTSGQVVKTPSQGILLFGYFNDDGYFVPVAHESFYGTDRTGGFVISHPGYKSGSYLRFNTNYRTSASPTSISLTAQEEIAYAQLNVTSTSAQLLNYDLYYNSSGSGSYSSGRNGYTTTTASDLAECAKVTHVMHTALPTNANTYKASWYGIYACSELLGYDVDPNTFNEATSLVDATGQTTSLNVNVTKASTTSVGVIKPDGTTTTVTDDGTLSVNTTALVTQTEVDGLDFKKVTETEYTGLTAPDANTVYFVVADPETT